MRAIYLFLIITLVSIGCGSPVVPSDQNTLTIVNPDEQVTASVTDFGNYFTAVITDDSLQHAPFVETFSKDLVFTSPRYAEDYSDWDMDFVYDGSEMTDVELSVYFAGNMVENRFGWGHWYSCPLFSIFKGMFIGLTTDDIPAEDVPKILAMGLTIGPNGDIYSFMRYMVLVQETNRFHTEGPGGFDVPDVQDMEPPCGWWW